MHCHARRARSSWREFCLAFHQAGRAIEPQLSLHELVTNWNQLAAALREAPRKRKSQEQKYRKTS
jgi:hypothetical protein